MALAGLSKAEKDEHCVCFAAPALHDGGAEINTDSIKAMVEATGNEVCLLYTSPSPRDRQKSRMPSSA